MNCKPGDLAIIVRSKNPENLGKMVVCKRIITDLQYMVWGIDPVWEIEGEVLWTIVSGMTGHVIGSEYRNHAPDFNLMPISDAPPEEVKECNAPVEEALS